MLKVGDYLETFLDGKAFPSILLPLILLILFQTFRVSSDDYTLWLRGSPPPPAITYIPLNAKLEALDRLTAPMLVGLIGIGLVLRRCSLLPSMYFPLGVTALIAVAMPVPSVPPRWSIFECRSFSFCSSLRVWIVRS